MSGQANGTKPIIILGAGISGLAFGQALHTHSPDIPFIIMERDSTFNQRSQGYRVALNGRAVDDVRAVMPSSLFDRLCGSCPERVIKEDGRQKMGVQFDAVTGGQLSEGHTWKLPAAATAPIPKGTVFSLSADRSVLRDVLIRGIEDKVQFSKGFLKYEIENDGVLVHFQDGTSVEGSLLVAADGARSRARRQLLGDAVQLWDTDIRTFYGKTPITNELEAQLHKEALTTGTSIIRDSQDPEYPVALIMEPLRFTKNQYRQELPDDYVFWALAMRQPRTGVPESEVRHMSPHETVAFSKRLTANWHPSVRPLFELQDENSAAAIRIATVKPGSSVQNDKGRVTLIGDAAHAMSPTSGAGAANAIKDGEVLARLLREKDLQSAIQGYEIEMCKYVAESLDRAQSVGKFMFNMPTYEEMRLLEI